MDISMASRAKSTFINLPKFILHLFSILDFTHTTLLNLFQFLGLSDWVDPDAHTLHHHHHHHMTRRKDDGYSPFYAALASEFLPVRSFSDIPPSKVVPESCAVCLCDYEGADEIRCLTNCNHIFHRSCLDRWMNLNRRTCPLCRASILPPQYHDHYEKRMLVAASGILDFQPEDSVIPGF